MAYFIEMSNYSFFLFEKTLVYLILLNGRLCFFSVKYLNEQTYWNFEDVDVFCVAYGCESSTLDTSDMSYLDMSMTKAFTMAYNNCILCKFSF